MSEKNGTLRYPHLFTPGEIGSVEIRNRTVMSAMGCSAAPGGYVNGAVINHYAERAKGGIGLVIVEVTCVEAPQGLNTAAMLRIDNDHYIPGMKKLADAIHANGAKCILQISHTGRGAKRSVTGLQPVAPSAVAMPMMYTIGVENETPRALTVPEIHAIEDKYAQAALRAKKAGFDGVEVHSTGYYLGFQFLSREANIRTDEYGGEPENRCRFHREVLEKIRALCGPAFIVAIKPTLFQGDHVTFEDGAYYATRFAEAGYDAIEVMGGSTKTTPDMEDLPGTCGPEGSMLGMCAAFRGAVKKALPDSPVQFFGGGRAYDPEMMEKALAEGQADFIFLGKGVFTEPHLVRYIEEDRYEEARPCIGCSLCMTIQLDVGDPGRCSGNAVEGRGDNSYELTPCEKRVVVVGGGLAGMEAARTAARRGCDVTLYEATELGGQLNDAMAPPHKDYLRRFLPYFRHQLEVTGVKTILGREATAEEILEQNPDAVILATGVKRARLPIPGIDKSLVVHAKDILRGRVEAGEHVVIVGGGVVGCETAELLLSKGKRVTIVEQFDKLAARMVFGNRCVLLAHLKGYGAETRMESLCKEIRDDGVVIAGKNGDEFLPCDTVIISVGDRPNRDLYQELKDKMPAVFNVGDSNIPDSFAESVAAGYYTAATLI